MTREELIEENAKLKAKYKSLQVLRRAIFTAFKTYQWLQIRAVYSKSNTKRATQHV
jgi:hypothetical protein